MLKVCVILALLLLVSKSSISLPSIENGGRVESYSGYRLLRTVAIQNKDLSQTVVAALHEKEGINIWKHPRNNQGMDFIASPEMYVKVQELFHNLGMNYEVLQDDIEKLIQAQMPRLETERQWGPHPMTWKIYHRYDDMLKFCEYLADPSRSHPTGAKVTMEHIGSTTEGRKLVLMKVSKGSENKPAIFIDGGMHAREWITPATVTFILDQLTTNTTAVQTMLNDYVWYIVPVANPDGYEFSWLYRMWRKTRSWNLICRGVDPNRNWAHKFGGEGTSDNPCSDIYRGTAAFSIPETRAIRDAILARKGQIKMYFTIHAYSQLLFVPWGYAKEYPDDYQQLVDLANIGKAALEATYNPPTNYTVGTPPDLIYAAAGGSFDWTKAEAGIKYSYAYELRDTGRYGFLLPPDQIIPTGFETFNSIRAMAKALKTPKFQSQI